MELIEDDAGILTSAETFMTAWDPRSRGRPRLTAEIGKALEAALGYKMGPLELIDLVGSIRRCGPARRSIR